MGLQTYEAKSWHAGLWQHQSTELHDTGWQKPSLYSFAICTRLWKHSKGGAKTHSIMVSLLLHKLLMVGSSGKIIWPFRDTINPTSFSYQSHQRWNFNDARVGKSTWVFCATGRKPPWQGLAQSQITYIKRKSRLGKKISLQSSNNVKTGETPHQDKDDK